MKKKTRLNLWMNPCVFFVVGLAIATFLGGGVARAVGNGNGIYHSPHDFTDNRLASGPGPPNIENDDANLNAWNNKRKEICRTCHVPHDYAQVRYGNQGLLWNHELTTKTAWKMYASDPTLIDFIDGTIEAAPAGTSKLCLGCHDGVTAINQYDGMTPADAGYGGGTTYVMGGGDYAGGFKIGATLSSLMNNHPISITYDNANDDGLVDPNVATMRNGDTVASLLVNGRLECSTCHDVHNRASVGGTRLLREVTRGFNVTGIRSSKLCFVCHAK